MVNEMLPEYSTVLMTDIWEDASEFLTDYQNVGIPTSISTASATTLYYLLYARYANNPIANRDPEQFKYKVFALVFQYGPTWEKRLDIQSKLRAITEEDLLKGSKTIYNHAYNPSTAPSTTTLDELNYINEQNTNAYKKSKMDAYAQLWDLLDTDVTGTFLEKFKGLFKQFVAPEKPLLYVSEVEDEEEGE